MINLNKLYKKNRRMIWLLICLIVSSSFFSIAGRFSKPMILIHGVPYESDLVCFILGLVGVIFLFPIVVLILLQTPENWKKIINVRKNDKLK